MTVIAHSQLAQHLANSADPRHPSTYLIHGQEMLVEQSVERVVSFLLKGADPDLSLDVVAGLTENIADVLERMNTFALMAGPKIVVFKDAKLYGTRAGQQGLQDRLIAAYETDQLAQAANGFLQLCGRLNVDLEAARQQPTQFNTLHKAVGGAAIIQMAEYCLHQQWQPTAQSDAVAALLQAMEKGFPPDHYLLVTAHTKVPKNVKLYKFLEKNGLVIDCHVPTGERRADKIAQDAVLRQTMEQQLTAAGKTLARGLFTNLCQLTGFDPRTFSQNIDKLIDYIGKRREITAEDIHHVLRRTKNDPVFELTNAVADRNKVQALFYLNTLLDAQWHPLQILSAVANQLRKLLVAKDFAAGMGRDIWVQGMNYQQFQQSVMPAIQAYDTHNRETTEQWQELNDSGGPGKKSNAKGIADVVLAPNPRSAYPVYQTLLKTGKFSMDELLDALTEISQCDLRLKSSAQHPDLVIQNTIASICDGVRGTSRSRSS